MGTIDLNKTAWKILNKGLERADELIKAGRGNEAKAVTDYMSDILKDLSYDEPIITVVQCKKEDRFYVGDYITTDLDYSMDAVNTQEHFNKIRNLYKVVYTDLQYIKLVVIKSNPIGLRDNVTFTRYLEFVNTEVKKVSVGYPILKDIYPKVGDYIIIDTNYELPNMTTVSEFNSIRSLYRITYISGSLAVVDVIKNSDNAETMILDLDRVKALPLSERVEAMATTALIRRRGF